MPFKEIQTCYAAVGIGGERTTFFYAEVTDDMKVGQGGGVEEEGELIEVVELSLDEVKDLMKQTTLNTTPPTLYGITWFLMNKA